MSEFGKKRAEERLVVNCRRIEDGSSFGVLGKQQVDREVLIK